MLQSVSSSQSRWQTVGSPQRNSLPHWESLLQPRQEPPGSGLLHVPTRQSESLTQSTGPTLIAGRAASSGTASGTWPASPRGWLASILLASVWLLSVAEFASPTTWASLGCVRISPQAMENRAGSIKVNTWSCFISTDTDYMKRFLESSLLVTRAN